MGARFRNEYVYIIDKNNCAHFVMNYYSADLGGSYRSDIYLENKSYCIHDLVLADEVEIEGEFLPFTYKGEWQELLYQGPSKNVATILSEAGLSDISISKLVYINMQCSCRCILEFEGFASSIEGLKDFDLDFWEQALSLAKAQSEDVAEQHDIIVDWVVEQVRKGDFTLP